MKRTGILSFVAAAALAALQTAGSCVDGVTPDCSDAAECGPTIIDSGSGEAASPNSEGGNPAQNDAAPSDAGEAGDAPGGG
jgi:hypothetical protein